jgi:predicted TIM-barrel enzyme
MESPGPAGSVMLPVVQKFPDALGMTRAGADVVMYFALVLDAGGIICTRVNVKPADESGSAMVFAPDASS